MHDQLGEHNELVLSLTPGVEMTFLKIPEGPFLMGHREDEEDSRHKDNPEHEVFLDTYWIAKTPVTVNQFGKFINTSHFTTTAERKGFAHVWNDSKWLEVPGAAWNHPLGPVSEIDQKRAHPVTQVSWEDALAFTSWMTRTINLDHHQFFINHCTEFPNNVNIFLPSEAQWEKAAKGIDSRIYPWGNEKPDCSYCNFKNSVNDTSMIGSHSPKGDSPFGCVDMAGNVFEWCADWYVNNYYENSMKQNPMCIEISQYKVVRGGSWRSDKDKYIQSVNRFWRKPQNMYYDNGFRCALQIIGK
jgi:formylglycine-generating enzyme required for sulfatase activity